ncbi:MAG: hypothetical protein KF862_13160 [Chitinophagaceae bacterium]|nr:hypothetical protein [Chitinophagaceae bacterium]
MISITFPLQPGDNNDHVANLKAALVVLIDKQQLGLGSEDSATFPIFLSQETGYGESAKRLVSAFQRIHQLPDTGIVDQATAIAFNKTLVDLGIINANGQPVVSGVLYMDYGIPANNIKLRLYAKGFGGSDTVVAETNTNKEGKYTLAYDPAAINTANFEVRAVDANNTEYALSTTLFSADKTISVPDLNLIAPSKVQKATEPEFTRLSHDITGVLGGMKKLTDAQEREGRQDITFLSQSINWDGSLIALAALSGKLSKETGLSEEAAYALVRTGLPNDAGQMAYVGIDDVTNALDEAGKSGLVNLSDAQKKEAVTAFQAFAGKAKLNTKNFSSLSTYNDLLANQPLTEDEKVAFATAYFTPRLKSSELWEQAKNAGIADDKIRSLQLQGKLGFLTADNAPLSQKLQTLVGTTDNLSKLVEEGLYEPAAWDAKLKEIAGTQDDNAEALGKLIPPAYVGNSIAERKQAYTEDMAAKIRTTFPEKVIRNRIEKGNIVLGDNTLQTGVAGFLSKAEDLGYKLASTHIDTFVKKNEATLFNGGASGQKTSVIEGVKMLSRVHQITPNDEAMQTILALGHSSAQDIVAVPREDFINRFATKYAATYKINIDEARLIGKLVYNKSSQVYTTTYSFFTAMQTMRQTPGVFAVSGDAKKIATDQASLSDKIKNAPNLQELFGSLDFCECEHCRSVLSPAAYLVDLLQFLDRKQTDWDYFLDKWKKDHAGKNYTDDYAKPYDALIERRPDIVNLPLTCENTNTALPYIDVVNEILEYYLVNKKLTGDAAYDTGKSTTPELLAEPQHIEPEAYSILKKSVYPLNLPFDLWIETVRQWCNQYEVPLWQVMETLQPIDTADFTLKKKIAIESLSISPSEYDIFSNENPLANLFELYGYSSNAEMTAGLKSAKQLANRLSITYKELLSLVQTNFVNPHLATMVLLQKMSITVSDVFRYKKQTGFTPFTDDEQNAFKEKLAAIKTSYGTDAEAEINNAWNAGVFKQILLLNDSNAGCNFDKTTFGYADRDALTFDLQKQNLFVRLWKKLGWTIEETDTVLKTFLPKNLSDIYNDLNKTEAERAKALAHALASAIIQIAHLKQLTSKINAGGGAITKLTTLWSDIPTTGRESLYEQLFLTRNVLKVDTIFDNALGRYLSSDVLLKSNEKDHSIALQAALHITATELEQILKDNGLEVLTAKLTMTLVSLLYRYTLLAKALRVSISELINLKQLSGLDPFAGLSPDALQSGNDDSFKEQTLRFIDWVLIIKESNFKTEDVDYLFRHRYDVTGKYRNTTANAKAAIKLMAESINALQKQYAVPVNPADPNDLSPFGVFTDDVLQQTLSLLVPVDVVQNFTAMWTSQQPPDWNKVKDAMGAFLSEANFNSLFLPDAADADDTAKQENILRKRSVLAKAILILIQQKLIRLSITQILAAATSATFERVEWHY